jgi:hypothetical protein
MNPIKKKKKAEEDDDDRGSKKSKKRRKIDSEEEFINPEDYVEKRRSGRASRGGRKNYDDNAVPNFSESPESDVDTGHLSDNEAGLISAALVQKKRGRKKKDSQDEGGSDHAETITEMIEDPLIVDKILSHRVVKRKKDDDSDSVKTDPTTTITNENGEVLEKKESVPLEPEVENKVVATEEKKADSITSGDEEEEFFIKWKGYSYIHCVWLFRDEIFDPRYDQKLRRYYSKLGNSMTDPDNEDIFNPEFVIIGK